MVTPTVFLLLKQFMRLTVGASTVQYSLWCLGPDAPGYLLWAEKKQILPTFFSKGVVIRLFPRGGSFFFVQFFGRKIQFLLQQVEGVIFSKPHIFRKRIFFGS